MTSPLSLHSAESLLKTFCDCITNDIHPVLAKAVPVGSELFGAAILRKSDLSLVASDADQPYTKLVGCPLWHGEICTIKRFFDIPHDKRPDTKDCLFLSTHEPCSMCLTAIMWAEFDNFTYMYTYEDTDKLFGIPEDRLFLKEAFYGKEGEVAQQASKDGTKKQVRPEYKLQNKYFVALSFAELVAAVKDPVERDQWEAKVETVKRDFGMISERYREYYNL